LTEVYFIGASGSKNVISEGGRRAKIKNEPRGSKTLQKDRDGENQGQKGFCSAYPDEKVGESEKRPPNPQVY
jgi:hypothetical protein